MKPIHPDWQHLRRLSAVVILILGTRSLSAQVGPLVFGPASGQPGEIVEVPVFVSIEDPLVGYEIALEYDQERLFLETFTFTGTAAAELAATRAFTRNENPGFGAVILSAGSDLTFATVPPAEDLFIAKILMRIRADAPAGEARVEPVVGVMGEKLIVNTNVVVLEGGRRISRAPSELVGTTITVAEPAGPRPVGELTCAQFLDRAEIAWTLTETYDSLEVLRDGRLVATLDGAATSHVDPLPGTGTLLYELRAIRAAESSILVGCSVVAVSPAAPIVKDITCDDGELSWRRTVSYDSIAVFRDGDLLATLPGDADSYQDDEAPTGLVVYTVVGELEGFRGPDANCLKDAGFVFEVGDVQASLDAGMIVVPIFLTAPVLTPAFGINLDIELTRLEFIDSPRLSIVGTALDQNPDFFIMGIGALGLPSVGILFDEIEMTDPELGPNRFIPVGLRQHIFNFVFRPLGEFQDGDRIPATLVESSVPIDGQTVLPEAIIPGEIRFGSELAPVEDLQATVKERDGGGAGLKGDPGDDIILNWRNGSTYDTLIILRNGEEVGSVSGSDETYQDSPPAGIYTYKVVGNQGELTSFPQSTFVSTVSPPGTFLRGDANGDSSINITDAFRVLNHLFLDGRPLPCEDAADANDDGQLSVTDPIFLLNFLFLGGTVVRSPGVRFPWYDPTADGLTCQRGTVIP